MLIAQRAMSLSPMLTRIPFQGALSTPKSALAFSLNVASMSAESFPGTGHVAS